MVIEILEVELVLDQWVSVASMLISQINGLILDARDNSCCQKMADQAEPPFLKHKRYYLFLKISVLIIAALLAANYFWGS
jgi:hypothetical protein